MHCTTFGQELLLRRCSGEKLKDIGNILSISGERVRQLEERALDNLYVGHTVASDTFIERDVRDDIPDEDLHLMKESSYSILKQFVIFGFLKGYVKPAKSDEAFIKRFIRYKKHKLWENYAWDSW